MRNDANIKGIKNYTNKNLCECKNMIKAYDVTHKNGTFNKNLKNRSF